MQVTRSKGQVTVKPYKRELDQLDNVQGMCRYLEHAGDAEGKLAYKAAADALEKVAARFREEATT